jgi:hypothetical protein
MWRETAKRATRKINSKLFVMLLKNSNPMWISDPMYCGGWWHSILRGAAGAAECEILFPLFDDNDLRILGDIWVLAQSHGGF